MKYKRTWIIFFGVLLMTFSTQAQVYSLSHGRAPELVEEPVISIDAGLARKSDWLMTGARFNFSPGGGFLMFANAGYSEYDLNGWTGPTFGGGALVQFAEDTSFNFGIRLSVDYSDLTGKYGTVMFGQEIMGISLLGILGGDTAVPNLEWFANIGFLFVDAEYKTDDPYIPAFARRGPAGSKNEPHIGGGGNYRVNDSVSVFVSLDLVEDLFVGIGLNVAFAP